MGWRGDDGDGLSATEVSKPNRMRSCVHVSGQVVNMEEQAGAALGLSGTASAGAGTCRLGDRGGAPGQLRERCGWKQGGGAYDLPHPPLPEGFQVRDIVFFRHTHRQSNPVL